jgi:hypothetical protein
MKNLRMMVNDEFGKRWNPPAAVFSNTKLK